MHVPMSYLAKKTLSKGEVCKWELVPECRTGLTRLYYRSCRWINSLIRPYRKILTWELTSPVILHLLKILPSKTANLKNINVISTHPQKYIRVWFLRTTACWPFTFSCIFTRYRNSALQQQLILLYPSFMEGPPYSPPSTWRIPSITLKIREDGLDLTHTGSITKSADTPEKNILKF